MTIPQLKAMTVGCILLAAAALLRIAEIVAGHSAPQASDAVATVIVAMPQAPPPSFSHQEHT